MLEYVTTEQIESVKLFFINYRSIAYGIFIIILFTNKCFDVWKVPLIAFISILVPIGVITIFLQDSVRGLVFFKAYFESFLFICIFYIFLHRTLRIISTKKLYFFSFIIFFSFFCLVALFSILRIREKEPIIAFFTSLVTFSLCLISLIPLHNEMKHSSPQKLFFIFESTVYVKLWLAFLFITNINLLEIVIHNSLLLSEEVNLNKLSLIHNLFRTFFFVAQGTCILLLAFFYSSFFNRSNFKIVYHSFGEIRQKLNLTNQQILEICDKENIITLRMLTDKSIDYVVFQSSYKNFLKAISEYKEVTLKTGEVQLVKNPKENKDTLFIKSLKYLKRDKWKLSEGQLTFLESGRKHIVDYADITFLEAKKKHTLIYTLDKEYLPRILISEIQKELDPSIFIRIHRKYIINLKYLKSFNKSCIELKDQDDTSLPVGKQYKTFLIQVLEF